MIKELAEKISHDSRDGDSGFIMNALLAGCIVV